MKLRSFAIALALTSLAVLVGRWLWTSDRGAQADAPASAVTQAASRIPPPIQVPSAAPERYARLHAEAAAGSDPLPGTSAFRAYAADFLESNPEATEHHMVEYGLTRAEVLELTFFGLLAMRSVDWEDVEAVLGRPVPGDARATAGAAMRTRSEEMKTTIAAHVKAGDAPETRKATIRRIQDAYLEEYFRATGMTRDLLDELLHLSLVSGPGAIDLEPPTPPELPELPEQTDLEAEQEAAAAAPPPPRPPRPVK